MTIETFSYLMTVVSVNEKDGEVLLLSLADGEPPCEMRWLYGPPCRIEDAVGDSYLVTVEQLSESVKK